jgi:hypothetical protein
VKLDLALRELHRSEHSLAADLRKIADRHKVDHEIHHVARDLAGRRRNRAAARRPTPPAPRHRGVSLDWELLAQAAQDSQLLALTKRCHPQVLRQMRWANAMLKVLSPHIRAS